MFRVEKTAARAGQPCRNLIHINKSRRGQPSILAMRWTSTGFWGAIPMIAIAAALLLAPPAALAGDPGQHAPGTGHGMAGHQTSGTGHWVSGHHGDPADTPHCHEKSPTPQLASLFLEWTSPDPQMPATGWRAPPPGPTAQPASRAAARIPIAGPPRFILFGNFRS